MGKVQIMQVSLSQPQPFNQYLSPIREINVGDLSSVLPCIKHWNVETPNGRFAHYAVGINTEKDVFNWLEAVTDEQYYKLLPN